MTKKKKNKGKKIIKKALLKTIILAAVIVVVALVVHLYNHYSFPKVGAKIPTGDYCFGMDISKYQPKIKWEDVKILINADGVTTLIEEDVKETREISYVFIKATEGTSHTDKHFNRHWKNAKKVGIRRGAYHFFRSSKDAEKQAKHFIKTVGTLSKNDLPPVLDIETIHDGCSNETLNQNALVWLRTVEKHYGRKPIVYSSASFITNRLCDEIKDNYPIWVAHYKTLKPRCKRWDIWQFSDQGVVKGIEGEVDLNVTTEEFLNSL